jgi:hypothetical protein
MSNREDRKAERKAKQELTEGKSPKTASGEFVHEEIEIISKVGTEKAASKPLRSGFPKLDVMGFHTRGENNRVDGTRMMAGNKRKPNFTKEPNGWALKAEARWISRILQKR